MALPALVSEDNWRSVRPLRGESCRWERAGEWVAVLLGGGRDLGQMIVRHSRGYQVHCDSFEDALVLASGWTF